MEYNKVKRMQKLEGFQNPDIIYESNRSLVYRTFEEENKRPVILKVLNNNYPTPEEISKFNQEYELAGRFENEGVIQTYEMLKVDDSPVIVMEDIGGRSLADILKSMKLSPDGFLSLGVRIAETIGKIHQRHIIHKDINPSNIIWNIKKDIVRIIDFGLATELPREITSVKNPNVLEGTLAYISPEQTGRMNRSLDYRTDFYSLGATFYWMLTGCLPFESKNLLKLVHCHLAIQPVPPHQVDENIPLAVSEMVMKLMAKNAEDRYLSAYGLMSDLERCRQKLRDKGAIITFALGLQDISDKFQIPQKLYGREQEIGTLMSAFERVREDDTELMLVSGFPGIGKSFLINEIHRPIVKHSGYFISGKSEKLKKDVPYSAIIQAFTGLAGQILAENEAEIAVWKEKILSVLGHNGKIITDMIPLFELVVGQQPEVPILGPVESQNRFNLVFQGFIKVLASKERPLILFLDDLQWTDLASLHLLKLFATDSDIKHLFIIGAYRHNETPDSHPLILTLDEIKKTDAQVNNIFLQPLNTEHVNLLLADTLNRSTEETNSLAELLIRKTRGNPFFINEFLKSLYKESLIEFFFEDGWSWNMKGIEEIRSTDNVVDLMAGKINGLPENSQEVLKLGACIGSYFNLTTLTAVGGKSEEDILAALNEVLQEGLLHRIDNVYRFSHDRVLEAAYSLIPDDDKTRLHYRIGNLKLNTEKEELQENIFYVVNQLNAGVDLVAEESEKSRLAELNLTAGEKALASSAYVSSLNYLKVGIGLLTENCWQDNYDFTLILHQQATVASQLCADYEMMNKLAEEVFRNARTILDKIKVYEAKIFACMAQNQLQEGIRIGLGVLRRLGVRLPEKPGKLRVAYELLLVKLFLMGKSVENLINLPEMKASHKLAVMQILSGVGSSAYYAAPELLPLIVINMVRLSVKHGNSIYSPYFYAAFGMVHCGVLGDINAGYEYGKLALKLVEKYNIREAKSRVWLVVWFFINHWKRPLQDSIKPLLEAYKIGLETGDLEFAAISAYVYFNNSFNSGLELAGVEQNLAKYSETIRKLNQDTSLNFLLMTYQTVLNLRGLSEHPCKLVGSSYDQNKMLPVHKKANDRSAVFGLYYYLIYLNYLFENIDEAFRNAERIKLYVDASLATSNIPLHNFYDSLVRLALHPTAKKSNQKKYLKETTKNQKKMKKWAFHAPRNHGHRFHLVEAETARVRGQELKARKHYKAAVELAHDNGFLNDEALSLELTAKFWLGINEEKIAALYMTEAYHTYRMWGAIAKVKHIEEKYRHLLDIRAGETGSSSKTPIIRSSAVSSSEAIDPSSITKTSPTQIQTIENKITDTILGSSKSTSSFLLDISTITKASQAISREMDLKKLLEKMIRIIMENAGAEKGYVLLNRNKELIIEAAANTSTKEIQVLKTIKVENSKDLSQGIVNYVQRTGKSVLLPNKNGNSLFINDPYLKAAHPKSVLCIPMRHMNKTTGVLYLENNITTNAFTEDRIEILNILLSQAVISLENAFVYNHLDELVKERTAQLETAQTELIENAHKAGMADIAAGTIHNIGNILNSVKISTQIIKESYKSEFLYNFKKANQLLRDNLNNIEDFIINNPKGRKLMQYYLILEKWIDKDTSEIKSHIDRLSKKVEAITNVVAAQQSYAGVASLTENCDLSVIIDDALAMQQEILAEYDISIEKEFNYSQKIPVQKTKLIHIAVNLINNAIEAMTKTSVENRKLTFIVYSKEKKAYIKIKDTGMGILPENLRKIFNHGYTTKEGGHGFGLHSSANYMTEMKGRMWAESEGEGEGASFVLEFPI